MRTDRTTTDTSESSALFEAMLKVFVFHSKFGLPIEAEPGIPDEDQATLRMSLLAEEFEEVCRAWENNDINNLAQELADLIYVCLGMAWVYGIPLEVIFDEVHDANMEKDGGGQREDGKILKPEGWEPPRIKEIMEAYRTK